MDPTTNSIAYAVVLRHRIHAAIEKKDLDNVVPGRSLWNRLIVFLETFDPVQMRYAGAEWRKLMCYVELIARQLDAVCGALVSFAALY